MPSVCGRQLQGNEGVNHPQWSLPGGSGIAQGNVYVPGLDYFGNLVVVRLIQLIRLYWLSSHFFVTHYQPLAALEAATRGV